MNMNLKIITKQHYINVYLIKLKKNIYIILRATEHYDMEMAIQYHYSAHNNIIFTAKKKITI